ncbi:hypothetical protein [Chryseobacterium sp. 18068]|uniref:hypothetical protein n=1 Tax=Chryseobacterium sp. 18068 TaxID=2681414 RepID=UPI001356D0B8|nr:hypothetical protein [Chryseobacterium sp. 18068]
MIKKTTLWRFLVCPILLLSVSSLNLLSAQTGPNDDFDGDGVINSIDIDDDNDGVPDAVESPSCYYTANEWNTLAKPAVGVSIASDLTTVSGLGNFTALGDNNNTVSAVQFVTTPAQTQNNQALFTMTFTLPVQLDAFYIKKSSTTQISGGNLMFEASNDAVTWTPLFSAASNPANTATGTTANGGVALTNFNKFSVAQNAGKYKYYRIRGTTANNVLAGIATEFYFDFNTTAYVASMFAKATCTDANIDGDGILPQFDLDTDGDGCSDALESGATTNTSANYQFTGNVGANGLLNSLEIVADNGIVNYTSTYSLYATSSLINACLDTDGDGIRDVIDVDDDNDGVLDTVEMIPCEVLPADGSFESLQAVASTSEWTNSTGDDGQNNIHGNASVSSGWTENGNTMDSWNPTTLLNGAYRIPVVGSGQWGGIANGMKASPAGGIFVGGLTVNTTTEGMKTTISGLKIGIPYKLTFYQANAGIDGTTPVNHATSQIRWKVQFGTEVQYSAGLTFLGPLNQEWSKVEITFTPTATTQDLTFTTDNFGNGSSIFEYIVMDGVSLASTVGCGALTDTDNDGIPNHLDLDSDGDGCSDLAESGVSPSTDVFTPPSANNNNGTSYGIDPTKLAGSQLNPAGTDTNNDGLNDSVDPDQNGIPNYLSTYNPYAIGSNYAACVDTDGDGIFDINDIDDDNDGILDAIESPACFYTETEAKTITSVTSELTQYSTYVIKNSYDGNIATQSAFATGQNWVGKSVFEITPATPLAISAVNFDIGSWYLSAGSTASTFKLQGWNGLAWVDLSAPMANYNSTVDFSISNTLQVGIKYAKYRIVGVAGTCYYSGVNEITLTPYQYNQALNPKPTCINDIDNDGIPNHLDLDSDGDGCPDALEAGVSVNAGAFTSMSVSGGSIYTGGIPSGTANAYVGNGTPAQYGSNGFFNGIETAVDNGIYNGSYTYSLYALSLGQNVCTDTDGDNVPDIFDIDDDNDGVLDKVECPTLFTNMATGGGFSTDAAALPNWYTATASATLPIAEPFTPTVITFSNPMGVANYGIGGGNQVNSQLTGGLFDSLDGSNTATGVQYVLQEGDPQHPIVNKLSTPLVAGVPYNYSFDLGNRASGSATKYIVMLYNADTKMAEKIITSGVLNTIPAVGATPSYKNFTGSFIPAASANYYLLFYPSVSGNTESDFVIDRVAVAGAGAGACDIDNDGIPNYLDLDSDGDGCPDTKEAILYNHATEASIAGDVKNGSGGVVTSTVNTPNAMVPGPYGNNGFADALQSASNPDAYKYVYTYLFVATDANVSTCDNKFLYDIDSDDDGIPDAVESPSCFYTEAQAMDITEGVTSDFGWTIANPLSKTYDDITLATNYGEISAPTATSIQNKALITFDLPVIDAAFINSITLNVGLSFGAGKWKLQGLNMMTNVWTDLSAAAGQALSAGTIVFNNTLQNNTRYHSYRIIGVDNINIANAARLIEFSIQYKNYNASYHRTKMGCSSDADGDGVPNYIDRDSDGDGCPDAVEAGIPLSKLVPGDFFNTGGTVSGAHVTVGGNYGDNGLGDDVETAPDSGIVNYTSTYTQYATNKTLNFCTDTDGDSVPDLIDLDDDNDGVLDTTECTYPATPTNTSTSDIFAVWSNATTAAGTNLAPTYLTSVGSWTAGSGLTAAISSSAINVSNVNGSSLADAFGANEYLEHPFTTTADNYNWLYYIRTSSATANYHWAMLISDDNFVTYTILNIDMIRTATGILVNDINDYQLTPSTAYKVRTYFWGATTLNFDEFTMFGYSECDTDNDGVPNRLDLDSDGDGCTDAIEAGTAAQAGTGNTSAGTVVNTSGTQTGVANAIVGNNTPAAYGANGFYNGIENNDTSTATYLGTYTYASAINAVISSCFCYRPAVTAGTILDTPQGITSLQRAGADNDNWPMVRKGAWTALESKTKGFVPNRLTNQQITDIPAANLIEGMMVYNSDANCLYINTDGTPTGWKCFNTQACPN